MSFNQVQECNAWQQPCDLSQEHMTLFNQQQQYAPEWKPQQPYLLLPTDEHLFEQRAPVPGSISSVSSPSVGVVPPKEEKERPRKARGKKAFLDEREAELLEKDDSLLTEEEIAIKKKAQNRLAQRAFRERKETKLKELEHKLLQSEEERHKLAEMLNEIKLQYICVQTENNLLRLDNSTSFTGGVSGLDTSRFTFPKTQVEFINSMVGESHEEANLDSVNLVYDEPQKPGRKVLAVGAVWDYLQIKSEEEGYERLDLLEVMRLLKGQEVCHGFGPAYPLSMVDNAILTVLQQYAQM